MRYCISAHFVCEEKPRNMCCLDCEVKKCVFRCNTKYEDCEYKALPEDIISFEKPLNSTIESPKVPKEKMKKILVTPEIRNSLRELKEKNGWTLLYTAKISEVPHFILQKILSKECFLKEVNENYFKKLTEFLNREENKNNASG